MSSYVIPPVNLIGRGCVKSIGREAAKFQARRALVIASFGAVGEAQAVLRASCCAQRASSGLVP